MPLAKTSKKDGRVLKFAGPDRNGVEAGALPFPVGGRKGSRSPTDQTSGTDFIWHVDAGAKHNYRGLGKLLAESGDLYRNQSDGLGLIQVLSDGKTRRLTKAADLAPVIADRVDMIVMRNGKVSGELPAITHLNAMLRSEAFLACFRPVDEVVANPFYLDDFTPVGPGYHDGGPGKRVLYVGPRPELGDSLRTVHTFLDVMEFSSNADKTNAVAAALTVLLRHHWLGEKPIILITATKSHAGKGTITEFARGVVPKCEVLYEGVDWPMQAQFQRQVRQDPSVGVVILDNVRLDSAGGRGRVIRSAFFESFVTNPELKLAAPAAGDPLTLSNKYVVIINTNDGLLSQDLLNRALSIHLVPQGDVQNRQPAIGNPKLEFLPQNRARIEAELRGMIERWRAAGCPLDDTVRHSMTPWAREIGGILKHNGFEDFLANQRTRRVADDPLRRAVGLLGAARPGIPLRPAEWARLSVAQGLAKQLISPNERDTEQGQARGIGVVLKSFVGETFEVPADGKTYTLRLEGGNARWVPGENPHVRYKFEVLNAHDLPLEMVVEDEVDAAGPSINALQRCKTMFTIGHGCKSREQFLGLLRKHKVEAVADVRLRPRARMGIYTKAKTPEKGIEKTLGAAGIAYEWFEELGNPDPNDPEMAAFRELFAREGSERIGRLIALASRQSVCLLCAEINPYECHRSYIADYLKAQGWEIVHL